MLIGPFGACIMTVCVWTYNGTKNQFHGEQRACPGDPIVCDAMGPGTITRLDAESVVAEFVYCGKNMELPRQAKHVYALNSRERLPHPDFQ